MKTTMKEFLGKKKNVIRNTIIGVTLTVVGVCLYNINQIDKKIDDVEYEIIDDVKIDNETLEEEA